MADVTIEPTGTVAGAGDTISFTAKLGGDLKDATYAWKRDGKALAADGQTLTISPVTSEDEGAYSVTITTSDGKTHETGSPAVLAVRGEAPAEWDDSFNGTLLGLGIILLGESAGRSSGHSGQPPTSAISSATTRR